MLRKLKHPFIILYHTSFLERGMLHIVLDYADGGDLANRISAAQKSRLSHLSQQVPLVQLRALF